MGYFIGLTEVSHPGHRLTEAPRERKSYYSIPNSKRVSTTLIFRLHYKSGPTVDKFKLSTSLSKTNKLVRLYSRYLYNPTE